MAYHYVEEFTLYQQRRTLYRELEASFNTKIIAYVTGDRRGLETMVASEVLDSFIDHLDIIGVAPKISLILYTRGGDTLAAWSLANLFLSFCDEFEVIISSKAQSAGTLISLAANSIVMTKQAALGPIDPSVNTPLNPPRPGAPPGATVPVSVEDVNGFLDFARITLGDDPDLLSALHMLAGQIHPLVLGNVYRARGQIRMLGRRLLEHHMENEEDISRILGFLCSESGSHDYTVNRREAAQDLHLPIRSPNQQQYEMIKSWHDDMAAQLQLSTQYDPNLVLGQNQQMAYTLDRALIESLDGGSKKFVSEGVLTRQQVQIQPGVMGDAVHDQRIFEGWRYEDPA